MQVYLKEKVGKPELFSGRKKELELFQRWIQGIPKEISRSCALLSRRKTGKTAIMQRLYNLTFAKHGSVIPFYYEIEEGKVWAVDFCKDFFLSFLYQYIAFKSGKPEYIDPPDELKGSFTAATDIAQQEGLAYLHARIRGIEAAFQRERIAELWLMVRDAPRRIATGQH
ncbi:MAG: hypothetical protein GY862_14835, partial [Gammaproteobacteria bacterium]|nr:hypothetical protein [Gammaproteobacteria bacterium]